VLIVHGERDHFIRPDHGRALALMSPAARLVLVPDAGHGNILETTSYLSALHLHLDDPPR
jgi:pimeloyl-ACP methyl ester carboxylesterase